MCRESVGKGLDGLRRDRKARRCPVSAESFEESGAAAEGAVQVERGDRPPRSFPEPIAAGDQNDRPVVALDEP